MFLILRIFTLIFGSVLMLHFPANAQHFHFEDISPPPIVVETTMRPTQFTAPQTETAKKLPQPLKSAAARDILLNQHGFEPHSSKLAVIIRDSSDPISWRVLDHNNQIVLNGLTKNFGFNAASSADPTRHELPDFERLSREPVF